ncbi:hypothetical protein HPO96_24090 [Kribbella sandramycini]|uniref:Uncharacterized protein n=1 Tax=Kribbella sandramycini TaxID=60450 RepID=A0A7Y4L4L0_9ACTN|nr:hypothetical protein [Kribbella sandramycini]MBB6571265.1 hypothetical protein [Kribbella sandramycini]NOL43331.1 hypothetical protein [Kribbella sandramycini]
MLLTACSSGGSDQGSDEGSDTPAPSTPTSAPVTADVAPVKAAEVVDGLSKAGFKCGTDEAYAVCTSGGAQVSVLLGDHPRPPVVSVHATGKQDTASAAIGAVLPKVLETVNVNQQQEISSWFGQQKATAQMTAGDWLIDYTVEADTEEPGVNLTVTDKLCKTSCQAE